MLWTGEIEPAEGGVAGGDGFSSGVKMSAIEKPVFFFCGGVISEASVLIPTVIGGGERDGFCSS